MRGRELRAGPERSDRSLVNTWRGAKQVEVTLRPEAQCSVLKLVGVAGRLYQCVSLAGQ